VFVSDAPNLLPRPGGVNFAVSEAFVRDGRSGALSIASLDPDGNPEDGEDPIPSASISNDGRFVVFNPRGTIGTGWWETSPLALRDRVTGTTTALTTAIANLNVDNLVLSADGRYVSFDTGGLAFGAPHGTAALFDRASGRLETFGDFTSTTAGGGVQDSVVSADGRYVAYVQKMLNGTPPQVMVKDRVSGAARVESIFGDGSAVRLPSGFALSADGRYLVFGSERGTFRRDLLSGEVAKVDLEVDCRSPEDVEGFLAGEFGISADGRYVMFNSTAHTIVRGDTNLEEDVFVRDMNRPCQPPAPQPRAPGAGLRLTGSRGDDRLVGTPHDDRLAGAAGNDVLEGLAGNDTLDGGPGNDRLDGGPGNDQLLGGVGADTIISRDGTPDVISCGRGRDIVIADSKDSVSIDCESVRRKG
jgi:Ca2+-binding RTX toxin-like protein